MPDWSACAAGLLLACPAWMECWSARVLECNKIIHREIPKKKKRSAVECWSTARKISGVQSSAVECWSAGVECCGVPVVMWMPGMDYGHHLLNLLSKC